MKGNIPQDCQFSEDWSSSPGMLVFPVDPGSVQNVIYRVPIKNNFFFMYFNIKSSFLGTLCIFVSLHLPGQIIILMIT